MTADEPGPPPGTYWDELERSFLRWAALSQVATTVALVLIWRGR